MNGDAPVSTSEKAPWLDVFNQGVRGFVVVLMTAGFLYGFVVSKVVSTESFAVVYGSVLAWWFASGKRSDDAKNAAVTATPPPPVTPPPGGVSTTTSTATVTAPPAP